MPDSRALRRVSSSKVRPLSVSLLLFHARRARGQARFPRAGGARARIALEWRQLLGRSADSPTAAHRVLRDSSSDGYGGDSQGPTPLDLGGSYPHHPWKCGATADGPLTNAIPFPPSTPCLTRRADCQPWYALPISSAILLLAGLNTRAIIRRIPFGTDPAPMTRRHGRCDFVLWVLSASFPGGRNLLCPCSNNPSFRRPPLGELPALEGRQSFHGGFLACRARGRAVCPPPRAYTDPVARYLTCAAGTIGIFPRTASPIASTASCGRPTTCCVPWCS